MIELQAVGVDVGERALLREVSARVEPGEFVAVLGPNGVGKTTLLRAIAGLHPIRNGAIRIDGTAVHDVNAKERALRLAFVTSDDVLLDALRVREVVAIGRFAHHRWWNWRGDADDAAAIASALDAVAAAPLADRLFSTLSSGERQRVWIALGLAQETPALLLDEPTSHLDVRVAHEMLSLLRTLARGGKSVLCVLHDLNDAAAYADRIALLGDGRLLALGTPNDVLGSDLVERAYGMPMERVRLPDGRLRIFAAATKSHAR